ncbi:MAG: hypothetical protein AAFX55_01125, partial [Bacteroidota bacterium]
WCIPCLQEFEKSNRLKKRIQDEENLEYIYLSIDDEKSKWEEKVMELKALTNPANHYLILDRKKSKLLKLMLIRENPDARYFTIPRYSILNAHNTIINNNAPRPSDSLMFKKIINQIN